MDGFQAFRGSLRFPMNPVFLSLFLFRSLSDVILDCFRVLVSCKVLEKILILACAFSSSLFYFGSLFSSFAFDVDRTTFSSRNMTFHFMSIESLRRSG